MKTLETYIEEFDKKFRYDTFNYSELVIFLTTMYREVREETLKEVLENIRITGVDPEVKIEVLI